MDLTDQDQRLTTAVREHAEELAAERHVPGLNWAIARRGTVIAEGAVGFADLERQEPMTPRSVVRSGSMGKTYVATAVMQLVEKGLVGLHEPINTYLPFTVENPRGDRPITVYDLLTHRPGMTSNAAGSDLVPPPPLAEHLERSYRENVHDSFFGSAVPKWSSKVGERFEYSNTGMATLGLIVERTNPDGLSFSDYVQQAIMDPLRMTSTQYPWVQDAPHVRDDILERMTTGYAGFGRFAVPTPRIYFADFPAGNVVTIPADHVRLLMAYLNGGELDGARILDEATVTTMLTPQVTGNLHGAAEITMGLAWFLTNLGQPTEWFGHGGAHMYGWHNDFRAYPKLDLAIAVHTNRWDMAPRYKHPTVLLGEFAANWLVNDGVRSQPVAPGRSWDWKRCYVAGVIMAGQLKASLSLTPPVTPEMVAAMADGAHALGDGHPWVADAFRAGAEDFLAGCGSGTYAEVGKWMSSDALQVDQAELPLLHQELGGMGEFPLPVSPTTPVPPQ